MHGLGAPHATTSYCMPLMQVVVFQWHDGGSADPLRACARARAELGGDAVPDARCDEAEQEEHCDRVGELQLVQSVLPL